MYMRNVSRVRTLLNSVVDEMWWEERLSPYNHNTHFPYFVTHLHAHMLGGWRFVGCPFQPRVVAMEDCPQCLDTLCNGAVWPCAYFAPPYSVLCSHAN